LTEGTEPPESYVDRVLTRLAGHPIEGILESPSEEPWQELQVPGPPRRVFEVAAQPMAVEAGAKGWTVLIRDITREGSRPWTLVWTALAMVFGLSIAVSAVVFLAEWGFDDNLPRRAAVMMAVLWIVVLWAWQQPFESLLMARERMVLTAALQVAVSVLKLASVYVFLQAEATGAKAHFALVLANLIGLALFVAACFRVEGFAVPRVEAAVLRRLLRECRPLITAMVLSLIYFKSDIVLLGWLRGDDAAGVYGAVQRIAEPVMMMAVVLGAALYPTLCRYSVASADNLGLLRRTSARLVLLVSMPMAFGLAAVAGPVIGPLAQDRAEEFAASVTVLQVTCAVVPFFYFNAVAIEFLYAMDENWFVVKAYALASFVSVAGNLVAVPLAGVHAVPCVAVVVNGLISVLYYVKLRGVLREARLGRLLLRTAVACGAMAALAWWVSAWSLVAAIAAGAAAYPLLQLALGTASPLERALAGRVLSGVTGRLRRAV